MRKITVAIGNDEYSWAQRRAKRMGTSISAVLTAAAREKRAAEATAAAQRRAWAEVLTYVTTGEPLSPAELESAQRELDRGARTTRRR